MKILKLTTVLALAGCMLVQVGCSSMSNTGKGALIGGGGGAGLGAALGGIIGGGKGAAIGAGIGAAVGTGAGALIGNKMDKAKKAAEAANAQAEVLTDKDGYAYVKATFPSGLLFASGKYALNASAKNDLATFARSLDADMDVCIYGYTDNDPWRGYTAEQSVAKNQELSLQRAGAVRDQLLANGLQSSQIREISGLGESNPVASNATAQGKEQNRRVEVFILPSKAMVEAANAEAAAAKQ